MNAVWQHSKSSGRARLVLLAIADHQGEIGAWPSISTIAKMVNASERSVQRDIQELQKLGELRVEVQNAPTRNQYKSNLYWVTLSGVTAGVTESQSGVTDLASGVTAGGVQTLIEPLQKHKKGKDHELPEDWNPSQELLDMFKTKWPDIDPNYHIEQFKLYYWGKGTKNKDWSLTFQRWMSQEQQKAKAQPWRAGSVGSTSAQVKKENERKYTDEFLREMAELEKQAAPAPKCQHGNNLALCKICLS